MSNKSLTTIKLSPREIEFLNRRAGTRGEVYYDQANNTLRLYDGRTIGGTELVKTDLTNVSNSTLLAKMSVFNFATETYVDTEIVNNTALANLDSMVFKTGVTVTEFSSDTTLGGNSNSAVPTERAVKTYVDTSIDNIPEVDLTGLATETFVTSRGYITSSSLTGLATETYVSTAISNLVDAAPTTLNTLNELAAALGDDANFATTVTTALGNKAPITNPTFIGTVQVGGNGGTRTITGFTFAYFDDAVGWYATLTNTGGDLGLQDGQTVTLNFDIGSPITVTLTNVTYTGDLEFPPDNPELLLTWGSPAPPVGSQLVSIEAPVNAQLITGDLTVTGNANLTLPALGIDSTLSLTNSSSNGIYNGSEVSTLGVSTAVTGRFEDIMFNLNTRTLDNVTTSQAVNNLNPVVFLPFANFVYFIETEFQLVTTGTISHTEAINLAAPSTTAFRSVITRTTIGGTGASTVNCHRVTAPGTTVITPAITTAQTVSYRVQTTLIPSIGGTYSVLVAFSAAPGGSSTITYSQSRIKISTLENFINSGIA